LHEKELPTQRSGEMNMSTISVSKRIEEASPHIMSPRTKARIAGGFYLATIFTGVFSQLFISHLVVSGDMAGYIVSFAVVAAFSTARGSWCLV
jgi:hypothetical protein